MTLRSRAEVLVLFGNGPLRIDPCLSAAAGSHAHPYRFLVDSRPTVDEVEIARVALDLVERRICERPTIRAVARELGIVPGTLYGYYPSLEALDTRAGFLAAKELLDSMSLSARSFIWDRRARVDIDLVEAFALHYLQFALERPAVYSLITPAKGDGRFVSGPRGDSYLWKKVQLLISRFTGQPDDSTPLAFWALLHGYSTIECPQAQPSSKLDQVPEGVSVLLRGLRQT